MGETGAETEPCVRLYVCPLTHVWGVGEPSQIDHNRIKVGNGQAAYDRAKRVLNKWG